MQRTIKAYWADAKGAPGHCHHVAAGILPAVEGGILPPGGAPRACGTAIPPGKMPGSTAGRMPAATAPVSGGVQMRPRPRELPATPTAGLPVSGVDLRL